MVAFQNLHILTIDVEIELTHFLLRSNLFHVFDFALLVEERAISMQLKETSLKDEFVLKEEQLPHYLSYHIHGIFFDGNVLAVLVAQPGNWEWLIEHFEHVLAAILVLYFVVLLYSLDGAVAEEAHEVEVQNPDIFVRLHQEHIFVDLYAELD